MCRLLTEIIIVMISTDFNVALCIGLDMTVNGVYKYEGILMNMSQHYYVNIYMYVHSMDQ